DRQGAIRCAQCSPATAAWLIVERLRATPAPFSAQKQAVQFLNSYRSLIVPGQPLHARLVAEAAHAHGIAPATLTRARWECGLQARKTRDGWIWTEQLRRA